MIWEKTTHILYTNETATMITYRAVFPLPISGWLAYFIEFNFATIENTEIVVTTEANVIPETYPFPDCTSESCYGTLV